MEGYLGKRGKRIGSRVRRYMRLEGAILSNSHSNADQPTWRVNIKDAIITCNTKRNRIVVELYSNKLELFADSGRECEEWYEALTTAQSRAAISLDDQERGFGNGKESLPPPAQVKLISLASDSLQDTSRRSQIGKKFKVVKPQAARASHDDEGSGGSDEALEGEEMVVQGQVYEETPASMIFKQFNFPAK